MKLMCPKCCRVEEHIKGRCVDCWVHWPWSYGGTENRARKGKQLDGYFKHKPKWWVLEHNKSAR